MMGTDRDRPTIPDHEPSLTRITLLMLGFVFVVSGQLLSRGTHVGYTWGPHLITAVGMVLFILSVQGFIQKKISPILENPLLRLSDWFGLLPYQILLLLAAPLLSLVAWLAAGDGLRMFQPNLAVLAWLMAIAFLFFSHLRAPHKTSPVEWGRLDSLILGVLFLLSLSVRVYNLEQIPWLLTGDEASAGLTSIEFIQGTRDNIFVSGWFSFPSLFFWVQSLSIRLFGQTTMGLRFPSMLAGALTVPAVYWFARPFLGRKLAILSSTFLAFFHFHIHFSRIGLNNIWDGLFAVLFIGTLWRAWVEIKDSEAITTTNFALAGLLLGLSLYFYTSVRVLLGMLIVFVILLFLQDRRALQKRVPGLSSTFSGFMVIFLPLGLFYVRHPEQFTAPFSRVSHLGPWLQEEMANRGDSAFLILAEQFKQAALGFTHVNLRSWYDSGEPMLLALPAALFILGLIVLISQLRRPIFQWLLLWLLSAISLSALSESTPAAQRLTIVAPAVAILVTLPLASMIDWISSSLPDRKTLVLAIVSSLLVISIFGDMSFYYGHYSAKRKFGDTNTEIAQRLANYLISLGGSPTVYFGGLPRMGYYTHSTIKYLVPNASGKDIIEPLQEPPEDIPNNDVIFVFLPERLAELDLVRQAFPRGEEHEVLGRNNEHLFTMYLIPSAPQ